MDHDCLSIGIDVGARWLDVATWPRTIAVRFPNTAAGHRDLLAWLAPRRVERIACEASGGYERGLAETLAAAGHGIRILPAERVRQFARAGGQHAKTDRIDAGVIAHCAATFDSPALTLDPARRDLAELVEARRQLLDALTTARNQTAAARLPRLRAMAAARIDQLRAWIKELDTAIAEQIAAHAPLARANALLRSVPGVGPATAARLLADMPELGSLSRQKVAALAGVAPFANDSGQRQGKRRMRAGRREVRCALYMAALSTTRHNPLFRPVYTRLVANGKPPKVAIGALMRKLLVTLNAILRTGQPWRHNTAAIAA